MNYVHQQMQYRVNGLHSCNVICIIVYYLYNYKMITPMGNIGIQVRICKLSSYLHNI